MATAPLLASQSSFYKRPLPPSCIAFNSTEGKRIFARAMREGNLESYFLLSGQMITQNEPAYCALGTLVMVLNAYEVDPQRKWKGPWRWYEQEMLDCCRPLTSIASVGLTLSEFACLARCNGLRATVVSPSPRIPREEAIARFRDDLQKASRGETVMVISYSRKALGQTGSGHFSPVGAYCEEQDQVLILDVARFKYPSYWISVESAWDSMIPLDAATGQPRGYVLLDVAPSTQPGSLAGPLSLTSLTLNKSSWAALSNSLSRLLLQTPKSATASDLLHSLAAHLSSLPTPALSPRPAAPALSSSADIATPTLSAVSGFPSLLDALSRTELATVLRAFPAVPTGAADPLLPLLVLALFSPRSSLTALVPLGARSELESLRAAALDPAEGILETEVEFLVKQLGALGECCRSEEENGVAGCGCASAGNSAAVEEEGQGEGKTKACH
ncbi:hypothetical protein JCM21900_005821 [Sporobolomyces salmonicolor]